MTLKYIEDLVPSYVRARRIVLFRGFIHRWWDWLPGWKPPPGDTWTPPPDKPDAHHPLHPKVEFSELRAPEHAPKTGNPETFVVDYGKTFPEGVSLPLRFEVQGPSRAAYYRRDFVMQKPEELFFVPKEGGLHNITLRELFHNKWWGALQIDIAGVRVMQ